MSIELGEGAVLAGGKRYRTTERSETPDGPLHPQGVRPTRKVASLPTAGLSHFPSLRAFWKHLFLTRSKGPAGNLVTAPGTLPGKWHEKYPICQEKAFIFSFFHRFFVEIIAQMGYNRPCEF